MSKDRRIRKIKNRTIPLADLKARSGGGRVSDRLADALAEHIAQTGLYPRLIVRPHPRLPGKYELLDGRLRARILREAGATRARCEVWDVGDRQAELLSLTLNSLRSRNADAGHRARQVRRLTRRVGSELAQRWLALTPAGLEQLLVATARPKPTPASGRHDVTAVVFHLPSKDAALLERMLRSFRGPTRKRSDALVRAIRAAAKYDSVLDRLSRNRRRGQC